MPLNENENNLLNGLFPESNTRLSVEKASRRNPDTYADYLKLAEESKLPVDTIERNVDEVKRRDAISKIDFKNLGDNYPHLNEWLSDENNASVAIDDLTVLQNLERSIWEQKEPWYKLRPAHAMENFTKTLPISFMQGMQGAGLALIDYAKSAVTTQQQSIEMITGIKPEDDPIGQKIQEDLSKSVTDITESIREGTREINKLTPRDLSILEQGMRSGLESTVRNIPGLAATLIFKSPAPMLTIMGGQTGFESYGKARVDGKSPAIALTYGAIDASIEVLTEMIPTKALMDIMSSAGIKSIGKEAIKFSLTEIGGEQAATLLQSLNAYTFGLDDELENAKTLSDKLAIQEQRQVITFFASLVGSASQTGITAIANLIATRASAKNLETTLDSLNDQQILENIITYSQDSKTNSRAKAQFESFLKAVGPDSSIYIPADVADKIIDPPEYIAEQLNENGIDIEIPIDKFSSEIVPNESIMSVIRPFMKMNPNRLNGTELKDKENVDVKSIMEKAQRAKDVKTEADKIYEEVKDQIVGTGRQAESTARLSAQLIPAYAAAKAERLGITPKAVYEAMGLRVVGPGAEVKPTSGKVILDQPAPQVPILQPTQAFGDIKITDTYTVEETGKKVKVTQDAQKVWDQTQKRKDMIVKLKGCLGG